MSERIVSPGVFTRENDLSFLEQGVGEIGAAFIGPLKQGPAFVPTIVRTQSEFEDIFGRVDGTYYTEYSVQNYLREAGTATIVRVAGIGGYQQAEPLALKVSGSGGDKLVATIHATFVGEFYESVAGFGDTTIVTSDTDGTFAISGSNLLFEGSASFIPSSKDSLANVFGESPFGLRRGYVYTNFTNTSNTITSASLVTGDVTVSLVPIDTQEFTYDASQAHTPWVLSQLVNNERYELLKFYTRGHGNTENRRFKISISNVKAAGEVGGTDYAAFTVTIRRFDDTDKRKVVLETFNNVNLDPASPNYIARVIGDRNVTISDGTGGTPVGKIIEEGDYPNNSRYIYVEVADQGSFPIAAAPFGHGAYTTPINAGSDANLIPAVVYSNASSVNTSNSPVFFSGIDLETAGVRVDNFNYIRPLPQFSSADVQNGYDVGENTEFGFETLGYELTGSNSNDMVKRQFTLAFQGGFDGQSPAVPNEKGDSISAGNSQGFNLSTSTASGSIAYSRAIRSLSNADEFDINMVVTPGVIRRLHPSVTTEVIDMVEGRQDCFYIADFTALSDAIGQATEQANEVDSNYVATYYPWVRTIDTNTNRLLSVPPSTLLPAVFAANDRLAAEWFAPAGLTRGGIIGAVSVVNRLTFSERDTLYENKVNPIASFTGQGIVAFGQKTLQDKSSALDRINVRRLLINVKKFIASTSRFLVFEQNTSTTRARFINTVTPYLEAIQQRQGLFAFRVVMDESNNTPDVIDRNILAGQLFLQPTRTAEFIVIDFNILPTGASFGD